MDQKCMYVTPIRLDVLLNTHQISYCKGNSPADKCKIWPSCAFHDKSVKFGTKLDHILTNVFSYRAIADSSRDPDCGHLLSDVINSVFCPLRDVFLQTT